MEKTGSQKEGKRSENDTVNTALGKAMALCAKSEFCSSDIRIKLESWGLSSSDAKSVISTLIKENFINDQRYADAFVKDRYRHNKWGKMKIAAHLRAKNIESEVIGSALSLLDEDQYRQMIADTLNSHRKFIKAKNQYDLKGKLLRFGLSKGFESHILYDILNELD
ncbi:MAG: RecX family transcriptional regulator [Bacteroidia bacterium]|nr:MAG: RecX family transcriptional regulator [Bacteroidia bacterium]